jgi:hypothetical protein
MTIDSGVGARENHFHSPSTSPQKKDSPMRSFFFWLTSAAALGAILAMVLRPGVPEVLIVLAVANALYYGITARRRRPVSP